MIIYEFRVQINGQVINEQTMEINCYETEYKYVPNSEEDRKKWNVNHPYDKNYVGKPLRNRLFYYIYTPEEIRLYDLKNKLIEFIDEDYGKQEKELEKDLYITRAVKDKIWSLN